MTRNANRTTKGERRFVRRYNPYAARILGVAEAARWYREGVLLDEARGFDNIVNDLKYGVVPFDLNNRVTAALDAQRDRLERILGVGRGMLTPTSSNANHFSGGDAEPLGPSACGYYEVVDIRPNVNVLAMPESWFAKYEAYRKGREAGDKMVWHEDKPMVEFPVDEPFAPIDPSLLLGAPGAAAAEQLADAYADWDGEPWRDPNEVAAAHAEAIENALNDDIDPGD